VVTQSSNANIADWGLEFDERMGSVVAVRWASLTAGTEVGVVADGALVTITDNVGLPSAVGIAKRSITEDACVTRFAAVPTTQRVQVAEGLVERHEPVAGVDEAGICNARRAVVPIRALETLVADAVDVLVAPIADGIVSGVTAGSKESLSQQAMVGILGHKAKGMLRVVAMLHPYMAPNTQVVIVTCVASDKLVVRQLDDAGIAGAGRHGNLLLFGGHESGLGLRELWLGCNGLCDAVGHLAILHETFDEPVVIASTEDSCVDTTPAQIEVTVIARAAMIVLVGNGSTAIVAIDSENAHDMQWW
jgi:hypothetical protein